MSKISNTKLIVLLLVLGGVIAAVMYFDSKKGERNFKTDLVDVNEGKISAIYIYPKSKKGQEVKLFKEGDSWKVRINESKSQNVDTAKISGLLKTITGIKPTRLAARTPDKWKEYEVDTTGTRVKVNEGSKETLNITIGKINFSGGRDIETFVRLEGDDETYAVNGYLEGTFNTGVEDWRDKTILRGNKDEWTKLSFSLGDTMRFQLTKQDSVWLLDGIAANEQKVNEYLNTASNLMGTAFADDVDAATLNAPQNSLEVNDALGNTIKVEGFVVGDKKIIRSSLNTDNLLNGSMGGVWERVFVDGNRFMPAAETAVPAPK